MSTATILYLVALQEMLLFQKQPGEHADLPAAVEFDSAEIVVNILNCNPSFAQNLLQV